MREAVRAVYLSAQGEAYGAPRIIHLLFDAALICLAVVLAVGVMRSTPPPRSTWRPAAPLLPWSLDPGLNPAAGPKFNLAPDFNDVCDESIPLLAPRLSAANQGGHPHASIHRGPPLPLPLHHHHQHSAVHRHRHH